jgi:hypothetical protein
MARYGRKAQSKVKRALHERKRGTLRSGRSGKRVTSRKQAIAIGLSEARRAGARSPRSRARGSARPPQASRCSVRRALDVAVAAALVACRPGVIRSRCSSGTSKGQTSGAGLPRRSPERGSTGVSARVRLGHRQLHRRTPQAAAGVPEARRLLRRWTSAPAGRVHLRGAK